MTTGAMEVVLKAIELQLARLNNLPLSEGVIRIIEAYSGLPNSISVARAGDHEPGSMLIFLRIENMLRHEVDNLVANNLVTNNFNLTEACEAFDNNNGVAYDTDNIAAFDTDNGVYFFGEGSAG